MIEFDRVGMTYAGATEPVLRDVSLHVAEGELCLVVGRTGSGKSTLLGAVNGLVPHFTGGTLTGTVTVGGLDTRTHPPRELAGTVGVVGQEPAAGFVADTVEAELAYTMEQLGLPPAVMRTRVEETLDLLGIADLRDRALTELSGGQQQRVAIGSALTAHPRVLVLDEPTSALDPTAAEEVLAAVTRLVHDLGVTVMLAEHRLERVVQYADQVVEVAADGTVTSGASAAMMSHTAVAPPVVDLGRVMRWHPLPLSVRDARRSALSLRDRLDSPLRIDAVTPAAALRSPTAPATALLARGVSVRYGAVLAVERVDLTLHLGEVTALMGRNGSGKSSLLWALQGSGPRAAGSVRVGEVDPAELPSHQARRLVGLVPQTPADLLYLDRVSAELALADDEADGVGPAQPRGRRRQGHRRLGRAAQAERDLEPLPGASARELLDRLSPGIADDQHPRDLSEGQRLALVLALALRARPGVLLLDEPTRGLDYRAKQMLTRALRSLTADGISVMVATHDVEFVAAAASRVAVMAQGEIVADGPAAQVVAASPAFAPQIAKVLAPLPFLTAADVTAALAGTAGLR